MMKEPRLSQAPPLATRRDVIAGVSMGLGSLVMPSSNAAGAPATESISHSAESIHQEVVLQAPRSRVYSVLTNADAFQKLILLSGAAKSGMIQPTIPAAIAATPGGAFSLFGGRISGRFIELVPDERIVQAWRPTEWAAGVFSITRFELLVHGSATRLVFDHTGFPTGQAEHLAAGWKGNYWEPLAKGVGLAGSPSR
jgi:activator of HSP90 ATPase